MSVHRYPTEPTSLLAPCCGTPLAQLNPVTDPLTRVDRDVTCQPDELADLEMSDILAALVDSVRGPRRAPLIARLREIKNTKRTSAQAANELLETAGLEGHFKEPDHGEPGHACIPPEVLMQAQDSLTKVLEIVAGHQRSLTEQGYPEPVVYGMVSNLHAVLLQRLL